MLWNVPHACVRQDSAGVCFCVACVFVKVLDVGKRLERLHGY